MVGIGNYPQRQRILPTGVGKRPAVHSYDSTVPSEGLPRMLDDEESENFVAAARLSVNPKILIRTSCGIRPVPVPLGAQSRCSQ